VSSRRNVLCALLFRDSYFPCSRFISSVLNHLLPRRLSPDHRKSRRLGSKVLLCTMKPSPDGTSQTDSNFFAFGRGGKLLRSPARERSGSFGSLVDSSFKKRKADDELARMPFSEDQDVSLLKLQRKMAHVVELVKCSPSTKIEIKRAIYELEVLVNGFKPVLTVSESLPALSSVSTSTLSTQTVETTHRVIKVKSGTSVLIQAVDSPNQVPVIRSVVGKPDSLETPVLPKTNKPTWNKKEETFAVSASGKSYAEILQAMKDTVKPDEMNIDILSIKKGSNNEMLIRTKRGADSVSMIEQAMSKVPDVKVRSKDRSAVLHIIDLDGQTTSEEIIDAFKRHVGDSCDIRVSSLRPAYGETQRATVILPEPVAVKLVSLGRIRVGYVSCKVLRRKTDDRCYKCWESGHQASSCTGPDRRNQCFSCSGVGHKKVDCPTKGQKPNLHGSRESLGHQNV